MLRPRNKKHYERHKEAARALVHARLSALNQHYRFRYARVFIKNSKSRWGSCSQRRNLNFNYKILFLPPKVQDYLLVHELCHLGEFNHSPRFWELVERAVPEHRALRRQLRLLERAK